MAAAVCLSIVKKCGIPGLSGPGMTTGLAVIGRRVRMRVMYGGLSVCGGVGAVGAAVGGGIGWGVTNYFRQDLITKEYSSWRGQYQGYVGPFATL